MHFDRENEITIMCERMQKGCTFVAVVYDRTLQRRFSHGGATAFEALAWMLEAWVAFAKYGVTPITARNGDDVPGSLLARLAHQQKVVKELAALERAHALIPDAPITVPSTSSFDNQIPRAAVPTPPVAKPSAASRRSSAKKKGTK